MYTKFGRVWNKGLDFHFLARPPFRALVFVFLLIWEPTDGYKFSLSLVQYVVPLTLKCM